MPIIYPGLRLDYKVATHPDGYFNRDTMKGIWLCGDYIIVTGPDKCHNADKSQPFARIDTVNDCDQDTHFCRSAQNTTSKQMSRLFLNILLGDPDDPDEDDGRREMHALLHEGQHGSPPDTAPPVWPSPPDRSFLTRGTSEIRIPILFEVDAVKIGQGPLKKDPDRAPEVRYEGLLIKWKKIKPGDAYFDAALKKKFDDLI
jgi:hypothetical protein